MPKKILITGGAGFIGSRLGLSLKKQFPEATITAYDNLIRKGSEIHAKNLEKADVRFIKGDVRNRDELALVGPSDLIIDCAAEPSVLAGVDESPLYVTDTNLGGTINCLELARMHDADFIFLSTSRIYPVHELRNIALIETDSRFAISPEQTLPGISDKGVAETFPIGKNRTLYGATKLASELLIAEYAENFSLRTVINRCGVIAGPGQFGKVDQGFMVLWIAKHIYNATLAYIGYNGQGKQVRDVLHIDDLVQAVITQIKDMDRYAGHTFNIGGGLSNSISLSELTKKCQKITEHTIPIQKILENRVGDIPLYISDYGVFESQSSWHPEKNIDTIISDIYTWIMDDKDTLQSILNS